MKKIFKGAQYYILVLIGFILFFIVIYFNFIRERLPKYIPFNLSEYQFWILLYICCTYIYSIKLLLLPKPTNVIAQKIISYITMPFVYFDSFIKHNKYIFPSYYKFFTYVTQKLNTWDYIDRIIAIYLLQIIPRIILVSILLADIFIAHNISIFYYFIILGIIPLFYRYFKYSLQYALDDYIQQLELKYEDIWILDANYTNTDYERNPNALYHDKTVSIREYLKIQHEAMLSYGNNGEYIEYTGTVFAKEDTYKQYRNDNKVNKNYELTTEDYDNIHKVYYTIIPRILELYNFIEFNNITPTKFYIPAIKIVINCLNLICWVYILGISYHTVKDFKILITILEIINKYYNYEEPFTGLHNYNVNMYISKDIIYHYLAIYSTKMYTIYHIIKMVLIIIILQQIKPKR